MISHRHTERVVLFRPRGCPACRVYWLMLFTLAVIASVAAVRVVRALAS